ncbi:MAG: hypothetical protein KF762_15240 [Acidobacteria bacterium]|nr:hypothetical protein [Acidobacteriota bacterium]
MSATARPVWVNRGTVYDALLVMLEGRQVQHTATKQIFFSLDPELRWKVAELHGVSEAEIFRQDAATVIQLSGHPRYTTIRTVPEQLYRLFEKDGIEDFIFENHIVAVPSDLANRLICRELEAIYGRDEVLRWPGFAIDYDCYDKSIRLDIEPTKGGFMRPVFRHGRLDHFIIYDRPTDKTPVVLGSREVTR